MSREQNIESTHEFGRTVDFGRTAEEYRRFRAGFPADFFDAMATRDWMVPGGRALDLGTGTGTVARGLAKRGLSVFATDPASELLRQAAKLDQEAGVAIHYMVGTAEQIEEKDDAFDLVTAGQCWHWFEREIAAIEIARVLKPGGRLVIAHFDWVPLPGNVVDLTEALILKYNPAWTMGGGTGLYPQWLDDLAKAGFEDIETFSFDYPQPYSHEAWRGRILASAGVKASLAVQTIDSFDAELKTALEEAFPQDPLVVPHRIWAVSGVHR